MPDPNAIPSSRRHSDDGASCAGSPSDLRSSLLLGVDHAQLGEVRIEELGPSVAVGISRGRFPKGYPHVDPNEDAVFAAADGETVVMAVADGHSGFDAALAAIRAVADAPLPTRAVALDTVVRDRVWAAVEAVNAVVGHLVAPRDASRTSLTVAATRHGRIATCTIGDTACFVTTRRRATRIGGVTRFLAPDTDASAIHVEAAHLPSRGTVILASDGVLDFVGDPAHQIRQVAGMAPAASVESLISAAFSGGAGDNVSVATQRLS